MTNSVVHPSTRILSSYSNLLEGKKIALGVTGSVAAYLSPAIARELIRHGAQVIPVMSPASLGMIGKDLMWWATGIEPITEVSGELEHISMAGVMNDPVDLMLIAPSTTNTVAKLAAGIADTSVSLIASSLHGKGIPIMVLCVAHEDLINSPAISDSLNVLRQRGIRLIEPIRSEGKAKMPEVEDIVFEAMKVILSKEVKQSVIVTAGPTREFIDNVRFITNSSSGKMGIEIAKQAALTGADVHLVVGPTALRSPRIIPSTQVISTQDMVDAVTAHLENKPESIVVLASAMSDFTPKEETEGKIKSGKDLSLELKPTTKLSDLIKQNYPRATLVLFKAEWDVSIEELVEAAKIKLEKTNGDLIVANDLSLPDAGFEVTTNNVIIMEKNGDYINLKDDKSSLAKVIVQRFLD